MSNETKTMGQTIERYHGREVTVDNGNLVVTGKLMSHLGLSWRVMDTEDGADIAFSPRDIMSISTDALIPRISVTIFGTSSELFTE